MVYIVTCTVYTLALTDNIQAIHSTGMNATIRLALTHIGRHMEAYTVLLPEKHGMPWCYNLLLKFSSVNK